jgi:carboxyl-terminal processing protease
MPRINIITIVASIALFLLCYTQLTPILTARNLGAVLEVIEQQGLHASDEKELFGIAVSAMAKSHDQHSGYIPPSTSDRYLGILDQQLSGIGISVKKDPATGDLIVQSSIIGQPHPAYDAGMRSGDQIIRVAGEPVNGKPLAEITRLIQGDEGTEVEIVIRHDDSKEELPLLVKRAKIKVDSVLGSYRNENTGWNYLLPNDPKIAYLQITDFGDLTASELTDALATMGRGTQIEGIIIDLRDNAGGYLSAAINVSDLFLASGNIVTTRGRGGTLREKFDADEEESWSETPLIILINGDTASASEIFAACMQDHQRATIVGSRSFGKGSVQQMIPLPDGGLLKLTTSSYHRPSGKNIHRQASMPETDPWGVQPDTGGEIGLTKEQAIKKYATRAAQIASPTSAANPQHQVALDADPVLQKAIEILREQIGRSSNDE